MDGIVDAVVREQMESLQTILLSMNKTLYFSFPFPSPVKFLYLFYKFNFFVRISLFVYMYIFDREEFRGVVLTIERMYRDGRHLVKGGGGSNQLNAKQLRQRIGIKPCLADCLDGLVILHEMHQAEYVMLFSLESLHGFCYFFLHECLVESNILCSCGL